MEFEELIRLRESVRSYDPERPVSKENLLKILEAGRLAPSAGNRQPWEFILASSPHWLGEIKKCYDKTWFRSAPHILLVKGRIDLAWQNREDGCNSLETDLAIAMDHMILAAANIGVGTCWIIAYDPAVLFQTMKLKKNERIFAITPLGYPREGYSRREKSRKTIDEVSAFI